MSDSGYLVDHIRGTFDLVVFKVIWGSFGALLPKNAGNWKTASRSAKLSGIWDSGVVIDHM